MFLCPEGDSSLSTRSKSFNFLSFLGRLLSEKDKSYELLGDSSFDVEYNYEWKFYKSKLGQKLYQRRTDIERLNEHLKDLFLIDPFPLKD